MTQDLDLGDCEEENSTRASDAETPRSWARDAIETLSSMQWMAAGTCPQCFASKAAGHTSTCRIGLLLRHAEHTTTPEDGRERRGSLRTVGRLVHWWAFTEQEIRRARQNARTEWERGRAERAAAPDFHGQVKEAAGAAGVGIDELVDAIADGDMEAAAEHARVTAGFVREAAKALEGFVMLEPLELEHVRCCVGRTVGAVEYLAGALERFTAFAEAQHAEGAQREAVLEEYANPEAHLR